MSKEIDHDFTDEIVCPHCGYEYQDSYEWHDYGEEDCIECEKSFSIERITTIQYTTRKV